MVWIQRGGGGGGSAIEHPPFSSLFFVFSRLLFFRCFASPWCFLDPFASLRLFPLLRWKAFPERRQLPFSPAFQSSESNRLLRCHAGRNGIKQ